MLKQLEISTLADYIAFLRIIYKEKILTTNGFELKQRWGKELLGTIKLNNSNDILNSLLFLGLLIRYNKSFHFNYKLLPIILQ